jgi:hypothetical protein
VERRVHFAEVVGRVEVGVAVVFVNLSVEFVGSRLGGDVGYLCAEGAVFRRGIAGYEPHLANKVERNLEAHISVLQFDVGHAIYQVEI